MGFFLIPGAGAGFFLSSWIVMVFWGIVAPDAGLATIGYTRAMVVTIALWFAVAPLLGAVSKRLGAWWGWRD